MRLHSESIVTSYVPEVYEWFLQILSMSTNTIIMVCRDTTLGCPYLFVFLSTMLSMQKSNGLILDYCDTRPCQRWLRTNLYLMTRVSPCGVLLKDIRSSGSYSFRVLFHCNHQNMHICLFHYRLSFFKGIYHLLFIMINISENSILAVKLNLYTKYLLRYYL